MIEHKPTISMIAALDEKGVIGVDGGLPWRLSAELKWFRASTLGKPVVMGRKTYDSIGRPLPKRLNIVMTRSADYEAAGCVVVGSVAEALAACGNAEEVMIIGGEAIYHLFLPLTTRLYLSFVEANVGGDRFFPPIDWSRWQVVWQGAHSADAKNEYAFCKTILEINETS